MKNRKLRAYKRAFSLWKGILLPVLLGTFVYFILTILKDDAFSADDPVAAAVFFGVSALIMLGMAAFDSAWQKLVRTDCGMVSDEDRKAAKELLVHIKGRKRFLDADDYRTLRSWLLQIRHGRKIQAEVFRQMTKDFDLTEIGCDETSEEIFACALSCISRNLYDL